jgi:glycolate oxidase FAD binding subunit
VATSSPSVAHALRAVLGTALADDAATVAAAAVDGRAPRWVARPASLEQLAQVLVIAHEDGLAVTPRGSASSLGLGAPPERLDIVLDVTGLASVLEWNPDDLTVTVQAGVTLGALARQLAGRGQLIALDPPCGAPRTLGGLAATNASGPLRTRYGTMRDLLLGVRFVQANGVITWGGAKVVKSVSGYDVPKLMVGALGTIGVLGELTLRLHPRPEVEKSWLVSADSIERAHAFVEHVLDSTVETSRLEILNAVAARRAGGTRTAVAVTLGSAEAAVRAQAEQVRVLATREGATVEAVPDAWWTMYGEAYTGQVMLRVSAMTSRLTATVGEIERRLPGSSVAGCAAVGTLYVAHPDARAIHGDIDALRAFVAADGGHVVIERGPRDLRASVDPWGPVEPAVLDAMRALKSEFDPARVLNPGRFVGGL